MTIPINAMRALSRPAIRPTLATTAAIPHIAGMKRFAYRSLVWLTALAFIAGSTLSHPCATANASALQTGDTTAHADHHQASHAAHHHTTQAEAADSSTSPVSDHHTCPSCCGLCTVASAAPMMTRFAITLVTSRIVFEIATERLTDWRALLDPDIPKSLA